MPANAAAILARRRAVLEGLRATTAKTVVRAWDELKTYDESAQSTFRRRARPVVLAGQTRAIAVTLASLAAVIGSSELGDRSEILEAAAVDLDEPFIALGRALNAQRPYVEAVLAGRSRAAAVAETAITQASRRASSAYDEHVVGWERIPSGDACAWCHEVASQVYKTAESADFGHARCSCDASPVLAARR